MFFLEHIAIIVIDQCSKIYRITELVTNLNGSVKTTSHLIPLFTTISGDKSFKRAMYLSAILEKELFPVTLGVVVEAVVVPEIGNTCCAIPDPCSSTLVTESNKEKATVLPIVEASFPIILPSIPGIPLLKTNP